MTVSSAMNPARYTTPLRIWLLLLGIFLLLAGAAAGSTARYQNRLMDEAYHDAASELRTKADSLRLSIERRLLLADSLKAFVDTEILYEKGIDAAHFEQFSSHFVASIQGIRNLSLYPGGKATYVYPLAGNEKVLGLDLFNHPDARVRENAERTRQTTEVTLLGPLNLTQGGLGLLTRQSVFDNGRFWGFVSVVLDIKPILKEAGLESAPGDQSVAIRADNMIIAGDGNKFADNRLRAEVVLKQGSWELATSLTPQKLESIHSKVRTVRFLELLSVLLFVYFVYIQLTQKGKLRAKVQLRTAELEEANYHIEASNEELMAIEEQLREQNRLLESKEQSLRHLAYHDTVTGLHNRAYFNEKLQEQLMLAERYNYGLALFYLDLDQFKLVNDTLGHSFGDLLLREAAERLGELGAEGDSSLTISRIGGDEFTIIVVLNKETHDIQKLARDVIHLFRRPFLLQNGEHFLTSSVGIAVYPEHARDSSTLIKKADKAMYKAKEKGKNQYLFYADDALTGAEDEMALRNSLHRALEREEFELHYQPQIALRSGQLIGMEALIRWHHPTRGLISPALFIPMAEETGMIVEIGEWVLRKACFQNRAWQLAGFPPLRMAVNLSARQFGHPDLAGSIACILEESELEPQYLELEITENMAMKNENLETLEQLRSMGITLSIDDFGTQHSSLSYLKRLPVNRIKIDRSFVSGIGEDTRDEAIILAMLLVARRLDLTVVAEGVETESQYTFLFQHECDDIQGFLFYRPQPAELIQKVLLDHLK